MHGGRRGGRNGALASDSCRFTSWLLVSRGTQLLHEPERGPAQLRTRGAGRGTPPRPGQTRSGLHEPALSLIPQVSRVIADEVRAEFPMLMVYLPRQGPGLQAGGCGAHPGGPACGR